MAVAPKLKLVEVDAGVAVLVVPNDSPPLAGVVPKPATVPAVFVPKVKLLVVVAVFPNVKAPVVGPTDVVGVDPKVSPPGFAAVLKFKAVAWVGCASPVVWI